MFTELLADTFAYNTVLKKIKLLSTMATIGTGAFKKCTNLREVKLPNKLTEIGVSAFASCYKLKSITIPDTVTCIGENVLKDASACQKQSTGTLSGTR